MPVLSLYPGAVPVTQSSFPVRIGDEFSDPYGRFLNYDCYDKRPAASNDQYRQLQQQKHVDVRVFRNDALTAPLNMLALDQLSMNTLDGYSMTMLESSTQVALKGGEGWTAGTVGKQSSYNNVYGLVLTCTTGTNTTQSVISDPVSPYSTATQVRTVDITGADDYISMAMPAFPFAQVNTSQCFLDLTSDPAGSFSGNFTDSVAFSNSVTTLSATDCELRLPGWMFSSVNKAAITGVRIRIQATASCTFRAQGLRAVSANWLYAPLDVNTEYQRVQRPVPPNGSATPTYSFPVAVWENYLSNGSFEHDTVGGSAAGWTSGTDTWVNAPSSATVQSAGGGAQGTHYLSVTTTAGSTGQGVSAALGVLPAGIYTFTLSLRVASGTATIQPLAGMDSSMQSPAVTPTITTSWSTQSVTFTVDGTSTATVHVRTNIAEATTFHVDAAIVAAGGSSTPYFDGDSTGYHWSGAVGNSPSPLTGGAPNLPSDWPVLLWADSPPGPRDPRPIDSHLSLVFNTGALIKAAGSSQSQISVFVREETLNEVTQLNLNGLSQAQLNNQGVQPNFGINQFASRTQEVLDPMNQQGLDQMDQFTLERVANSAFGAWIEVQLLWKSGATSIVISDTNGNSQTITATTLSANTSYIMLVDTEENGLRVRIYPVDTQGNIVWGTQMLDTTTINDYQFIRRRQGRIGWYAQLLDGDAWLQNIRPRGLNFGEWRSHPWQSLTPVDGARLYVAAQPDRELFNGWNSSYWGGTIVPDTVKSQSGNSFKITPQTQTSNPSSYQGIMTNALYFDNFDQTEIDFDVLFPTSPGSFQVFLLGEYGRAQALHLPSIGLGLNQWERLTVYPTIEGSLIQTGLYRLVLLADTSVTEWYIDNMSIKVRGIEWGGRGTPSDAWKMNMSDWTPFKNTLNSDNGGVKFKRGKSLQVRAKMFRQDAHIDSLKVLPHYAELGNFVWADQALTSQTTLSLTYSAPTVSGRTITATASASGTDGGGHTVYAVTYYWTFGDGQTQIGQTVKNTYTLAGTYPVTVTAVGSDGYRISSTHSVTIT